VANSNRYGGGTANAAIVSITVPAAAAVVHSLSTGLFPREFTTLHDGQTLLLTDYGSNTLQVITPSVQ
jgi:DNA-binding beta-propeller fold protein YncE